MDSLKAEPVEKDQARAVSANESSKVDAADDTKQTEHLASKPHKKPKSKVGKLVSKLISRSSKHADDKKEEIVRISSTQVKRKLTTADDESVKKKRKKIFDVSLMSSSKKNKELSVSRCAQTKSVSVALDTKPTKKQKGKTPSQSGKAREQLRVEKDLIEIFGSASPPQGAKTSAYNKEVKSSNMQTSSDSSKAEYEEKTVLDMGNKHMEKSKEKGVKEKSSNKTTKKDRKDKVDKSRSKSSKKHLSSSSLSHGNNTTKSQVVTSAASSVTVTKSSPKDSLQRGSDKRKEQTKNKPTDSVTENSFVKSSLSKNILSELKSKVEVIVKQSEECITQTSVVSSKAEFDNETKYVGAYSTQIGDHTNIESTCENLQSLQTTAGSSSKISEDAVKLCASPTTFSPNSDKTSGAVEERSPCESNQSSRPTSRESSRSGSRRSSLSRSDTTSLRAGSRPCSRQSQDGSMSPESKPLFTERDGTCGVGEKNEVDSNTEGSAKQSLHKNSRDSSPKQDCPGMEQLRLLSEQLSSLDAENVLMPSPLNKQTTPSKHTKLLNRSPRRSRLKSVSPWKGLKTLAGHGSYVPKSPKFSPRRPKSPRMMVSPGKSRLKRRLYDKSPLKMAKKRKLGSPEKKPRKTLHVKFQFSGSEHSSPGEWMSDGDGSSTPSSPSNQDDRQLSEEDDNDDPPYFPTSPLSSDTSGEAEEQLAIDCDVNELDVELDNKSKKLKLTARNVKSIINEVIKNEHVSDLFRKSLIDNGWEDQLKEAIFEPKMTRSRVKEVIQNGNFPPPWTLSPIKGLKQVPKEAVPSILEMNFSDNEDDQEYKPTLEELEQTDDDDLSMMSSQASELGSPMMGGLRQNPSTPTDLVFGRKLFTEGSSTPKSGAEPSDTEEEELIAGRTRSKLPLKDTPLDVIESNFVAPDITPDMYDTICNDKDWTCFLESLNKDEQLNDTYDDEQNDPEFNFLAEQEQEELDREDYRDDKAVRISKKELNELMDELFEAYGGADLLDDDENTKDSMNLSQQTVEAASQDQQEKSEPGDVAKKTDCASNVSEKSEPSSSKQVSAVTPLKNRYPGHLPPLKLDPTLARLLVSDIIKIQTKARDGDREENTQITDLTKSLAMSAAELIQLQDQMRKHVQLLSQTYIQAENQSTLINVSNMARGYLTELQHLGEKTLQNGFDSSHFHPPNLSEAIELTKTEFAEDTAEMRGRVKEKMVYMKALTGPNFDLYGLSFWQMELFVSSRVFIFPQMLPESRFPFEDATDRRRVAFTEAEDNLLIIGLQQFQHMSNKFNYIQRFLLPSKTQEQLRTHCKNLRGKRKQKFASPLQDYLKSKKVPTFERYLQLEDLSDIVRPANRNPELLPQWWPAYVEIRNELASADSCFIPINPDVTGDEGQRKTPTYPALLKAKKVSKHDPTDKTVGLSGLQHFKTNISRPSSRSSSRSDSPQTSLPQESLSSMNTTSDPSTQAQTHITRERRDSVSSTDSATSETGRVDTATVATMATTSFTAVTAPKVAAVLNNNGSLSTVTVLSSVRDLQPSSQTVSTMSLVSNSSISSSSNTRQSSNSGVVTSQTCLNKRAMKTMLPDVDMNITNDLDAIHPSVTFIPASANISISEAAIFSNSSNSETTLSAGVLAKSSVSSPIPSASAASTLVVDNDKSPASNHQSSSVEVPSLLKTPAKTSNCAETVGTPSLISSAMAEVIGVPVSELCTPEGIKKMGITPSKVPELIQPQGEKRTDVRKSLVAVYEAETAQSSTQTSTAFDPVVEEKNKNLILGILQEKKDTKEEQNNRNFITEILEEKFQSSSHRISFPQASINIPESPQKLSSSTKSSTQVTPVREKNEDFFKISPVDLNLIAENSTIFPDKPIQRLQDFDCESTLVTPKKVDFEDFYKESPSSSRQSVDCNQLNSMPFGITALGTPDTPSKAAVKLMAELAGEILSPEKPAVSQASSEGKSSPKSTESTMATNPKTQRPLSEGGSSLSPGKMSLKMHSLPQTPSTLPVPCQSRKTLSFAGRISPKKSTPVKMRHLLPDGPLPETPEKSPMFKKTKTTPRRKILKQNARAIAPKGLVQITTYASPVKQVAAAISARAKNYVSPQKKPQGRLRTLLPKSPKTPPPSAPPTGRRRILTSPTDDTPYDNKECEFEEDNVEGCASDKEIEEEFVMTRRQRRLLKKQRTEQLKEEDKENDTPSDGGVESQDEMDEDEQEHLNQLMAACTTIRFDPRQQENTQLRSKGQIKKDTILEMLAPDLLEADPLRDERDTAFAQSYMNKVRESLKNEPDKYSKFLNLLFEFGSSKSSPTDLYTDMYHLFAGHPELLEDFSGFLLPGQAKECGCLMAHLEFQKARTFLRKLEVHFKRLPGMLQRVLKTFAKWESLPTKNIKDLQDEIRPLLKGQQYLLDEFAIFFADDRVPESYMTDFEEVNFVSGDEETSEAFDGFEDVTITGADNSLYGTKKCICQCHTKSEKPDYRERKKHCISCGIKIIKGRLYLQCDNRLRPLHIKYSHPVKIPSHMQGENGDQEEEGVDAEELEFNDEEEIVEDDEVVEEEEVDDDEEMEEIVEDEDEKEDEDIVEDDEEVIEDEEKDDGDLAEVYDEKGEEVTEEKDGDPEVIEDDEEEAEDDEEEIEDDEDEKDDNFEEKDEERDCDQKNLKDKDTADNDGEKDDDSVEDSEDIINNLEEKEEDDDDFEEVEINEDMGDEELSLSEGDDKDILVDDEFSSDEEDSESDGEQEDVADEGESEMDEEAGTKVTDETNVEIEYIKKGALPESVELMKETDHVAVKESEQCELDHDPTDFSKLTEEIQFGQEQSGSGSNLAFRSSGSSHSNLNSVTKLSVDSSTNTSGNPSHGDSSSGQTESNQEPSRSKTAQASLPGPPVLMDEAASFNLVTQINSDGSCTKESDITLETKTKVDVKSLFGEFSDTEDTMGTVNQKQNRESAKSSQMNNTRGVIDAEPREARSDVGSTTPLEKWSIEEDKLILEKVQASGPSDHIFKTLGLLLGKTSQQVEGRFATLLALLTADQDTSGEQSEDHE